MQIVRLLMTKSGIHFVRVGLKLIKCTNITIMVQILEEKLGNKLYVLPN